MLADDTVHFKRQRVLIVKDTKKKKKKKKKKKNKAKKTPEKYQG